MGLVLKDNISVCNLSNKHVDFSKKRNQLGVHFVFSFVYLQFLLKKAKVFYPISRWNNR